MAAPNHRNDFANEVVIADHFIQAMHTVNRIERVTFNAPTAGANKSIGTLSHWSAVPPWGGIGTVKYYECASGIWPRAVSAHNGYLYLSKFLRSWVLAGGIEKRSADGQTTVGTLVPDVLCGILSWRTDGDRDYAVFRNENLSWAGIQQLPDYYYPTNGMWGRMIDDLGNEIVNFAPFGYTDLGTFAYDDLPDIPDDAVCPTELFDMRGAAWVGDRIFVTGDSRICATITGDPYYNPPYTPYLRPFKRRPYVNIYDKDGVYVERCEFAGSPRFGVPSIRGGWINKQMDGGHNRETFCAGISGPYTAIYQRLPAPSENLIGLPYQLFYPMWFYAYRPDVYNDPAMFWRPAGWGSPSVEATPHGALISRPYMMYNDQAPDNLPCILLAADEFGVVAEDVEKEGVYIAPSYDYPYPALEENSIQLAEVGDCATSENYLYVTSSRPVDTTPSANSEMYLSVRERTVTEWYGYTKTTKTLLGTFPTVAQLKPYIERAGAVRRPLPLIPRQHLTDIRNALIGVLERSFGGGTNIIVPRYLEHAMLNDPFRFLQERSRLKWAWNLVDGHNLTQDLDANGYADVDKNEDGYYDQLDIDLHVPSDWWTPFEIGVYFFSNWYPLFARYENISFGGGFGYGNSVKGRGRHVSNWPTRYLKCFSWARADDRLNGKTPDDIDIGEVTELANFIRRVLTSTHGS